MTDHNINITEFQKVYDFWFPTDKFQNFWFSDSTYDTIIRDKFQPLITFFQNSTIEKISNIVDNFTHNDKKIAFISIVICLDQFTRNISRLDAKSSSIDRSIYKKTDDLCYKFVKKYFDLYETYPINQKIFLLLPFRHQRKTYLLDYVMLKIKDEEEKMNGKIK